MKAFIAFRQFSRNVTPSRMSASVAQWANALSEPQCAARHDWVATYNGLGSSPGQGVGFSVGWTNSGHAMRLISRRGTEGLPVSSLNCDRYRHDTRKWFMIYDLSLIHI